MSAWLTAAAVPTGGVTGVAILVPRQLTSRVDAHLLIRQEASRAQIAMGELPGFRWAALLSAYFFLRSDDCLLKFLAHLRASKDGCHQHASMFVTILDRMVDTYDAVNSKNMLMKVLLCYEVTLCFFFFIKSLSNMTSPVLYLIVIIIINKSGDLLYYFSYLKLI